jgi:hypothetical protein
MMKHKSRTFSVADREQLRNRMSLPELQRDRSPAIDSEQRQKQLEEKRKQKTKNKIEKIEVKGEKEEKRIYLKVKFPAESGIGDYKVVCLDPNCTVNHAVRAIQQIYRLPQVSSFSLYSPGTIPTIESVRGLKVTLRPQRRRYG